MTAKRKPGRPRKKMSAATVIDEVYRDERKEAVKMARKLLGEKAIGKEFRFGSGLILKDDPEYYKRRDYEIVFVEVVDSEGNKKRDTIRRGGDVLMMIDAEIVQRRRDAPAQLAKQVLEDATYGTDDENAMRVVGGGVRPLVKE